MESSNTSDNGVNSPYQDIDKCKSTIVTMTKEIDDLFAIIENRNKNWLQSKSKLNQLSKISDEGICTLNIRGQLFQTSLYTLKQCKGTMFYNQILSKEIVKGQITFYDREPKFFPIILNYLRTLTLPDTTHMTNEEKAQLTTEAEYYSITPIVNSLKGFNNNIPIAIQSVLIEGSNYHLIKGDNKNTILNIKNNTKGIIMKNIKAFTIKYNQLANFNSFDICGIDVDSIPYILREKLNLFNEDENDIEDNHTNIKKEIIIMSSLDNEIWIKIGSLPSSYNDLLLTVKCPKGEGQYIKFVLNDALFHISYFKLNIG